jgi:hypothetical protein
MSSSLRNFKRMTEDGGERDTFIQEKARGIGLAGKMVNGLRLRENNKVHVTPLPK